MHRTWQISGLRQPTPQQWQAEADHVGVAALQTLHDRPSKTFQCKATCTGKRLTTGDIGLNLLISEISEEHPGGHTEDSFVPYRSCGTCQQTVSGMQITPAATHPTPTLQRLSRVQRLPKHLAIEDKHRITAQNSCDLAVIKLLVHSTCLCLSKPLHQCGWLRVLNCLFIDSTHPHTMGNRCLLEQASSCRRSRGQEQHERVSRRS